MAVLKKDNIINNSCSLIASSDLYYLGILMSSMHMAWVNSVCGRLKGDYRYSNNLVYNNFPWPEDLSDDQMDAIRKAAKIVLECRKNHTSASLADLYNPLTMPKDLFNAHKKLDQTVEKAYLANKLKLDLEKLSLLFELYLKYTAKQAMIGVKG